MNSEFAKVPESSKRKFQKFLPDQMKFHQTLSDGPACLGKTGPELLPFANLGIFKLVSKVSQKLLKLGLLTTWSADRG